MRAVSARRPFAGGVRQSGPRAAACALTRGETQAARKEQEDREEDPGGGGDAEMHEYVGEDEAGDGVATGAATDEQRAMQLEMESDSQREAEDKEEEKGAANDDGADKEDGAGAGGEAEDESGGEEEGADSKQVDKNGRFARASKAQAAAAADRKEEAEEASEEREREGGEEVGRSEEEEAARRREDAARQALLEGQQAIGTKQEHVSADAKAGEDGGAGDAAAVVEQEREAGAGAEEGADMEVDEEAAGRAWALVEQRTAAQARAPSALRSATMAPKP